MTSRATMTSSATPGQPGSPRRPDSSPSWQQAVAPASVGSWACWGDDAAEGLHVLQRPAHHAGVGDALPVVGEHADPGAAAGHEPQLGELLAPQALGDGTDRLHVDDAGGAAERVHALRGLRRVGHRARVGHRQDGGVAAARRGRRARADRLRVLAAGLAQVGVEVDEAREQHEAVGLHHPRVGGGVDTRRTDLRDDAVDQQDVGALLAQERGAPHEDWLVGHAVPSPASRW
ncbi:hypothetical protein QE405_001584 [Nocardioides zeae]|uniref:Uncharacterized protein n=1 Tax=Nocardioides zeae TaxID=1457234 RepID=A0AAJ1TYE9_9ACTN|nr:hypothetical protein [Nocardioides zeae]